MGKKGPRRHLKRFSAPAYWPISKKAYVFTIKPKPGPHPIDRSIPLLILIRDELKYAETATEARKIIKEGKIKVDGKTCREPRRTIGLMDVIEIPKMGEYYRILPHPQKGLIPYKISQEEATYKLCRIENKTTIKGENLQLNLHDGRNIFIKINDKNKREEDVYKTMDVLKISLQDKEILQHIKFKKNAQAIIIGGKNIGLTGRIIEIVQGFGRDRTIITLEKESKDIIKTSMNYTFIIGEEEPIITIPNW